jgi:hypothetical protein
LKLIEDEFSIASTFLKSEYRHKVKKNNELYLHLKDEIFKRKELLNSLYDKENANSFIVKKAHEIPYIGEKNIQSLDYSQIITINKNAKRTCDDTAGFIKSFEAEMKKTPLLSQDDPAYLHYLNYNSTRLQIKKAKKGLIFRRILIIVVILCVILLLVYLINTKTKGGDHIKFEGR